MSPSGRIRILTVVVMHTAYLCAPFAHAHDAKPTSADALERCLVGALPAFVRHGGQPRGGQVVRFLRKGDSYSVPISLREDGCVGVLAVGHQRASDLDLYLHGQNGNLLVASQGQAKYEYARYCGVRGLKLVATVRMIEGQGEFRLVVLDRAPETLPDLVQEVGECFAPLGGTPSYPADVGPEPEGATLEASMDAWRHKLVDLGYRDTGAELRGDLAAQHLDTQAYPLVANRCYALAAAAGPGVRDLDLLVRKPDGQLVGGDASRERDALVKFCCPSSEEYLLETHVYQGAGEYAVRVFELDESAVMRAEPGIEGSARIEYAEMIAQFARRGMTAHALAWGFLWPGRSLSMPIRLEGGRCYAIGGVSAPELASGDLDLSLVRSPSELAAWDVGSGTSPLVYHCPRASGTYHVVGRVYGGRGRYLVLVGKERSPHAAESSSAKSPPFQAPALGTPVHPKGAAAGSAGAGGIP